MAGSDQTVCCIAESQEARAALAILCKSINLTTESYGSVSEYLSQPGPRPPDCIVLEMPAGDARALELLSNGGGHAPLIVILPSGERLSSRHGNAAFEVFEKPFPAPQLLEAMARAVQQEPSGCRDDDV